MYHIICSFLHARHLCRLGYPHFVSMPPTIPISFRHPTPLIARTLHDCVPCTTGLRTQKLSPILTPRNATGIQNDGNIIAPNAKVSDTPISDITLDSFAPYEPSFPLHPSAISTSSTSESSAPPKLRPSSRPHINTAAVVITFSIAFTSILCGLFLVMLMRCLRRRNFPQRPIWFNRRRYKSEMTNLEDEPIVSISVDYTGGTALIRDITKDLDLERKEVTNATIEASAGPPYVPPSIRSTDSLALRPGCSIPSMTDFQKLLEAEEADITMAIGIAMRDCTYSGSELSTISQGADKTTAEDYFYGWESKNRSRKCSDASDSTKPTTGSDGFSIAPTTCSSLTSIMEVPHDSDLEELNIAESTELDLETGDTTFEVVRAQAQSMEIKRGVLFNWCGHRASLSPVLEEVETSPSMKSLVLPSNCVAIPSLVVTCPSMMTISHIRPSFSSVSVDLNDFPLPPSAFEYGQPFDDCNMCMPVIPELNDNRTGTCTL